jgi:hypothetical protein
MIHFTLLFLALAEGHDQANPLFRDLLKTGVALSAKTQEPLPPLTMPDGLDGEAQKKILKAVGEKKQYDLDELLEKSVTGRFVWETRDVKVADPSLRAWGVDVWFVAHGPLRPIGEKDFLEKMLRSGQKDNKVHILTEEELAKRNIKSAAGPTADERFSNVVFTLLGQIEVSATNRTLMTRSDASILFATQLDRRFVGDADYPDQWRPTRREEKAEPYVGAGSYVKITKLDAKAAGRDDALFVECRLVFAEPKAWFPSGPNLLKSKIPTLVQDQVRSFRKEVSKLKN